MSLESRRAWEAVYQLVEDQDSPLIIERFAFRHRQRPFRVTVPPHDRLLLLSANERVATTKPYIHQVEFERCYDLIKEKGAVLSTDMAKGPPKMPYILQAVVLLSPRIKKKFTGELELIYV